MGSFTFQEVDTESHAAAFESKRVILLPIVGEQLLPYHMAEVGKERLVFGSAIQA